MHFKVRIQNFLDWTEWDTALRKYSFLWFQMFKNLYILLCIGSRRGRTLVTNCLKVRLIVTQLCLTLCDPRDYSLPGSSVHEILQARILEWVASLLQGIFPTQGSNLALPHCRQILHHLNNEESPALSASILPLKKEGNPAFCNRFYKLYRHLC